VKPVRTLNELRSLSDVDPHYGELTILASRKLGGRRDASLEDHQQWLRINAMATAEEEVVNTVNLLIPQLEPRANAAGEGSTAS
jgi:hypothetical protein